MGPPVSWNLQIPLLACRIDAARLWDGFGFACCRSFCSGSWHGVAHRRPAKKALPRPRFPLLRSSVSRKISRGTLPVCGPATTWSLSSLAPRPRAAPLRPTVRSGTILRPPTDGTGSTRSAEGLEHPDSRTDHRGFLSHEQVDKERSISALHLRPRSGVCVYQRPDSKHQGGGWPGAARPSEPVLVSVRAHIEFLHVGHGRFANLRMEGWGSGLCFRLVRGDQQTEKPKALPERRGRWSHAGGTSWEEPSHGEKARSVVSLGVSACPTEEALR